MAKRIYVGNLPYDVGPGDVRDFCRRNADVAAAKPKLEAMKRDADKKTTVAILVIEGGMPDTVVGALNGSDFNGRKVIATTDPSVVIHHEEDVSGL